MALIALGSLNEDPSRLEGAGDDAPSDEADSDLDGEGGGNALEGNLDIGLSLLRP